MFEYRITKCDPAIRSEGGKYTEWTSFSEVGATFDGKVLTQSAYEEVEAAYIAVATAFLREADAGFHPQVKVQTAGVGQSSTGADTPWTPRAPQCESTGPANRAAKSVGGDEVPAQGQCLEMYFLEPELVTYCEGAPLEAIERHIRAQARPA